ncbi:MULTISPECIES: hypothetical protein [unclassified Streptomyces]|uniref:hypothetical protein n=1 Tax=unclassified Streptomyces TaxID=2593676 RepID=UPI002784B22A|nr:hypothetical protein [Streptomyces sp. B4I13]MDQ0961954.1 putative membrane protein YgcG [Streptomyces sp. B4I13]
MNKVIGVAVALVIVGALVAVGCDPAPDDCDTAGGGTVAVELAAAHTGKGGSRSSGRKSSSGKSGTGSGKTSGRSGSRHGTGHSSTSHGYRHADGDCDD